MAARITPTAIAASTIAVGRLSDSPRSTEITAEAAPSVATMGVTIEIRPIVSAA